MGFKLSGVLVDSSTKQPIARGDITVTDADNTPNAPNWGKPGQHVFPASGETDVNGRWVAIDWPSPNPNKLYPSVFNLVGRHPNYFTRVGPIVAFNGLSDVEVVLELDPFV